MFGAVFGRVWWYKQSSTESHKPTEQKLQHPYRNMEYKTLGTSTIQVSRCCLGTMTWGSQNTQAEAHAQLDTAFERGVNYLDTAEMYPVPPRAEWWTNTESIIGAWLKDHPGRREQMVLATKMAGPNPNFAWLRGGNSRFTRKLLQEALDGSCKRLGTEVIDLYYLHWPERAVNIFGALGWKPNEQADAAATPLADVLATLADFVQAGRIRTIGLSNETPWGVMQMLKLAEAAGLPKVAAVQNPYSLLNRSYEVGLAEVSWRENCGLHAYAPLAAGVLSGKYLDGAKPEGARFIRFPQFSRYFSPAADAATAAWVALAQKHGMHPATLAHAFVYGRPFLTASIVGATNLEQLKIAIDAEAVVLSDELLSEIEEVHSLHRIPCP